MQPSAGFPAGGFLLDKLQEKLLPESVGKWMSRGSALCSGIYKI